MKFICPFLLVVLIACNPDKGSPAGDSFDAAEAADSSHRDDLKRDSLAKRYENDRFRNVTVQNIGGNRFLIEGEAQIFEANFGWAVEDGHNELKKGSEMTDAGAPDWGKFKFVIDVEKQRSNSTLTLVLFETSAKDGRRQHELPLVLK